MKLGNKILIFGLIAVQSVFSVIGVRAVYEEIIAYRTDSAIYIDGYPILYENPVVTIDDSIYVPLRETFEKLDSEVIWRRYGTYVYTKDWYNEIETSGYTYHFINKDVPLNKERLIKDGLKKVTFTKEITPSGRIIKDFTTVQGVAENFSIILDETGGYRSGSFKDNPNYYFEVYNCADVWLIVPQRKVLDIVDWEAWYTIDKNTGEIEEDEWLGRFIFSYYVSQLPMQQE